MSRRTFNLFSPADRHQLVSPFVHHRPNRRMNSVLCSCLLILLLCSRGMGGWNFTSDTAFAATRPKVAPGKLTLQHYLQQGRHDPYYRGPLIRPNPVQLKGKQAPGSNIPVLPSAETPTMKPIQQALTTSFLAGSSGTQPLDLISSDHRLEVQIPPGAFDFTHAHFSNGTKLHFAAVSTQSSPISMPSSSIPAPTPCATQSSRTCTSQYQSSAVPQDPLTFRLIQIHGHFTESINMLGEYQMQIVNAQGIAVTDIQLHHPIIIIYHYQQWELDALGLDPGHLYLAWPSLLLAARKAHQPTINDVIALHNDPKMLTLTGQSSVIDTHPFDEGGGDPSDQSPTIPHLASVEGNAGQFAYAYPLHVPPGSGGFTPQLALDYSSEEPNDRHDRVSPAGDMGDGWALSLGSITGEEYPNGTKSTTQWYFLNNVEGVSDRLVENTNNGKYETEHMSRLRVVRADSCTGNGGHTCFYVWDTSGTYYVFGNTMDSLQYLTDSNGKRHGYRWDLNAIIAPNEGPNTSYNIIQLSYLQDSTKDSSNYTTIRDDALKQVTYGFGSSTGTISTVVGTVDFSYLAPFSSSSNGITWATQYNSSNYHCNSTPPAGTNNMRCDDPQEYSSDKPLLDMSLSTMSLQNITSYVGTDTGGNKAYSYTFAYTDTPFVHCYDPVSLVDQYCAGEHLLTSITPTVYQSSGGHTLKPTLFGYSSATATQNYYYDSQNNNQNGKPYNVQTYWQYLTSYLDSNTGEGANITYATAYNNTHGTPWQYFSIDGQRELEDRYDPLYCSKYSCTGSYSNPDDHAWSMQIVTQIASWGTDSSNSQLHPAITSYSYQLAKTGTYFSGDPFCNPGTGPYPPPLDYEDCVGDDWIPPSDTDWQDYYHSEFHGFAVVFITDPAGNLTVDNYYSTDGWGHPESDFPNYNSGQIYEEDVYNGNWATLSAWISDTQTIYAGDPSLNPPPSNACMPAADLGSTTYIPCKSMPYTITDTEYNGTMYVTPSSVQIAYTYDDYTSSGGLQMGHGNYHNLTQEIITPSNTPSTVTPLTKTWSYAINDQSINGWVYYTVDKVKQSSLTDASNTVWDCQDISYDEEIGTTPPTPSAGLPTTFKTYSDCKNKSASVIKQYAAYDFYGNLLATVDGVGVMSQLYNTEGVGCQENNQPPITGGDWSSVYYGYTTCTAYDANNAQPVSYTNALSQQSTVAYDPTQGNIPTSMTDPNNQTTSAIYIYDANSATNGKVTVQVSDPGENGSYTTQSSTYSTCPTWLPSSSYTLLPCYETDSISSQYQNAINRTYYDSDGRAAETLTPVPVPAGGNPNDTYESVVYTIYNDAQNSKFVSQPFTVVAQQNQFGTLWLDPNGATDYQGNPIYGTATYYDAAGRVIAVDDPIFNEGQSSGIYCPPLGSNATACTIYGLGGPAGGDQNIYATTESIDPNDHVSYSFTDALGNTVYTQEYSGLASGTLTLVEQKSISYNALNEPVSVTDTDEAPLPNQSITSVTTTAEYDSMGRITKVIDPDLGHVTYAYDADGRAVVETQTDPSSGQARTLGYVYDLLGRLGCVQDAASSTPSPNTNGACTNGNPYVQNTYDTSKLFLPGITDYPVGQLTQSVTTTYYPNSNSPTESATVTQSSIHDDRGQLSVEQMQFGLPSSWNVNTPLPTYQLALTYNDANQITNTTTSTITNGQPTTGYTTMPVYDNASGAVTGLDTPSGVMASLSFNAHALLNTLTLDSTTGSPLVNEQFAYDGDLRPASESACWVNSGCNSGTIFSQNRSYDQAGNVTSLATTLASVPGYPNSGGSETQNFCYNEQNELMWAGNTGTQPSAGSGTCGNNSLSSGLTGASYNKSYVYTHLGQLWQVTDNLAGTTSQYLYCDSTHPHQLQGIYIPPSGQSSTCTTPGTATYTSSYTTGSGANWGSVASRTVGSSTASLSYDHLHHLTLWKSGSNQEHTVYDASGSRVLVRTLSNSTTTMTVYAFGLEEYAYSGNGTSQGSLH